LIISLPLLLNQPDVRSFVLVSPLFIFAIVFPDISPPDYSDIAMRVVNVPESQNGYYDLIKAEPVSDSEGTIKNPLW